MPSILVEKGSAALKRVKEKVNNLGTLTVLVAAKSPGGSVQSCAINASVIGDAVNDTAMKVIGCFNLSNDQKINKISELLDTPQLVYANITPDHHFVFFSVDDDKVVILQGFQGVYNCIDWNARRGDGIIRRREFIQAMTDLISSEEGTKLAAAVKLFSYDLLCTTERPGDADTARVKREVEEYFRGKTVNIVTIGHKLL